MSQTHNFKSLDILGYEILQYWEDLLPMLCLVFILFVLVFLFFYFIFILVNSQWTKKEVDNYFFILFFIYNEI